MKKADISIGMILAIVLILVIILVLVWKLKDTFFRVENARSCEQVGGKCMENNNCAGTVSNFKCTTGKICCLEASNG